MVCIITFSYGFEILLALNCPYLFICQKHFGFHFEVCNFTACVLCCESIISSFFWAQMFKSTLLGVVQ